jgi:hypothetical protein
MLAGHAITYVRCGESWYIFDGERTKFNLYPIKTNGINFEKFTDDKGNIVDWKIPEKIITDTYSSTESWKDRTKQYQPYDYIDVSESVIFVYMPKYKKKEYKHN